MPSLIDLTGQRFGRWVVLEKAPRHRSSVYWICKCDCGTVKAVNSQSLRKGESLSCGCYHYEELANKVRTHGKSKTRLYNIWASMRERCYCPSLPAFKYYGGKGITVCDEWQDFAVFEKWALENGYDATAKTHKCTIDRIDNTKGYSPTNCRWVDSYTQANNISSNRPITYNGKTKNLSEWCRELNLNYHLIYDRLFCYGWDVDRAFTEPVRDWSPGRCRKSDSRRV